MVGYLTKEFKWGIKLMLRLLSLLGLYGPLAVLVARKVRWLSAPGPGKIGILALNSFRNMVDLKVLAKHPDLCVMTLDHTCQDILVGMWLDNRPRDFKDPDFSRVFSPEEQARIVAFLTRFLPVLAARLSIHVLTTPNFYYRRDHFFIKAANAVGLATVSMFKEAFYADYYPDSKAEQFKRTGNSWRWVTVPNIHAQRIALLSDAAAPERVIPCGILRMDELLSMIRKPLAKIPTAVLFSFTHTVGLELTTDPRWVSKCFFLDDENEGFVRLFNAVHTTFVRTARDNPQYRFVIKLLWAEPFKRLIREACMREGLNIDGIPNLSITDQDPIRWIKEADVVVGEGSAVLLESLAADTPVLFPLFVGAEYNDHYYRYLPLNDKLDFEDKPQSPDEFSRRLIENLERRGQMKVREKYAQILHFYLGSLEPNALERHAYVFKQASAMVQAAGNEAQLGGVV